MCDGDYDCRSPRDTSDEDKCRSTVKCLPNQSECDQSICLDTAKFCDGFFDCLNDELPQHCRKCTNIVQFKFVILLLGLGYDTSVKRQISTVERRCRAGLYTTLTYDACTVPVDLSFQSDSLQSILYYY